MTHTILNHYKYFHHGTGFLFTARPNPSNTTIFRAALYPDDWLNINHTLAIAKPATEDTQLVQKWMDEFDEDALFANTEEGRCHMVVVKGVGLSFMCIIRLRMVLV